MRRGSVVVVALAGDYGKPRPALVVQADLAADLPSIVVVPITTTVRPDDVSQIRIPVEPSPDNDLREPSEIMVDKVSAVHRNRVRQVIGSIDEESLRTVSRLLATLLGLA